jgi:hypothetical protein
MVVAFIGLDLFLIFCVCFNCVQGLIIWYCYNKVLLSCLIIFEVLGLVSLMVGLMWFVH